jgi:hypothetical protein
MLKTQKVTSHVKNQLGMVPAKYDAPTGGFTSLIAHTRRLLKSEQFQKFKLLKEICKFFKPLNFTYNDFIMIS